MQLRQLRILFGHKRRHQLAYLVDGIAGMNE
jgi:hypothetical protein